MQQCHVTLCHKLSIEAFHTSDSRTDQIAKLKQTIATLEEQQRTLGIDLSLSLNQMRGLLTQVEQTGLPKSTSIQSRGGYAGADQLDTSGDVVANSKIESRTAGILPTWGVRLNWHDRYSLRRSASTHDECPA